MTTLTELLKIATERSLTAEEREQALELLLENDPANSAGGMTVLMQNVAHAKGMDDTLATFMVSNIMASEAVYRSAEPPVHRVHFLKTAWFRYAAAIILVFGTAAYLWNSNNKTEQTLARGNKPLQADIAPGGDKATLTLSDGTTITLDSVANGTIAQQGIASIRKLANGELRYDSKGGMQGEVLMNTMTTPRGGQYQLRLPDGTRVWLNAASSITYPAVFAGDNRKVTVTGEAYFEVAASRSAPFIVKTSRDEITVLGTSFNVNSYSDEPASKVSLLTGAVRVNNVVLTPGEAYRDGKIIRTNLEADMAWKNGTFNFEGVTVAELMRQLARWYDLEIVYKSTVPEQRFRGGAGRDLTLLQIMEGIEPYGIKYTLRGKTLTIE